MDKLSTIDSDLFLFLNGLHVGWMDKAMIVATDMWIWLPLYLLHDSSHRHVDLASVIPIINLLDGKGIR